MSFKKGNTYGHATLGRMLPGRDPTEHPTILDIAWAAGIYEGEGCCCKTIKGTSVVTVSQKHRWLTDKLRDLFGGTVRLYRNNGLAKGDIYRWHVSGTRARGFLLTSYQFLSPHRQAQALKALGRIQFVS